MHEPHFITCVRIRHSCSPCIQGNAWTVFSLLAVPQRGWERRVCCTPQKGVAASTFLVAALGQCGSVMPSVVGCSERHNESLWKVRKRRVQLLLSTRRVNEKYFSLL